GAAAHAGPPGRVVAPMGGRAPVDQSTEPTTPSAPPTPSTLEPESNWKDPGDEVGQAHGGERDARDPTAGVAVPRRVGHARRLDRVQGVPRILGRSRR